MKSYYLVSAAIILIGIAVFMLGFENKKNAPRDLVTLAVMSAVAVISRLVFISLPNIKPITGIIMMTGMSLGPFAGFIVGAISAFVSNFFFGQGPWTPWQVFAYGLGGFLMGLLSTKKIISHERPLFAALLGAAIVFLIIGPVLDTSTLFQVSPVMNSESIALAFAAGIPVNAIHAFSTFLTILFLCRPVCGELSRIRTKYGLME